MKTPSNLPGPSTCSSRRRIRAPGVLAPVLDFGAPVVLELRRRRAARRYLRVRGAARAGPRVPGAGLAPTWKCGLFTGDTSSSRLASVFYLIEFELNCSPTLGSEKIHKTTNWKACQFWFTSLSAVLQKLLCAVRGFASWQSQQRRLGSPYGPPTSHAQAASASCASCRSGSMFYIFYLGVSPLCKISIRPLLACGTGGICVCAVQREPAPGGPGSGFRRFLPGRRPRALPAPAAALVPLLAYLLISSLFVKFRSDASCSSTSSNASESARPADKAGPAQTQ
jgi:hypothetical protein